MTVSAPSKPRSIPFVGRMRRTLTRLRQLHPPVVLFVRATPEMCLQTLVIAAKPSQHRLHLRDLFADGRRYYIDLTREGFRLNSNSRLLWGRRRDRTDFAATLYGSVTALSDEITSVRLHARSRWFYTLRGLLIPAWISAIVLSLPWPLTVQLAVCALLFALAFVSQRLSSALQAIEMVFFVQKALGDLPPAELKELAPAGPDVVQDTTNREFRAAWQRFYEQHREE